jgi:hypothetical protein
VKKKAAASLASQSIPETDDTSDDINTKLLKIAGLVNAFLVLRMLPIALTVFMIFRFVVLAFSGSETFRGHFWPFAGVLQEIRRKVTGEMQKT